MPITKEKKTKVISDYKLNPKDSGSSEVQVALLTTRINELAEHFNAHKKDHHSRYGLINMVSKRKKLLKYIKNKDVTRYQELISRLNIRK